MDMSREASEAVHVVSLSNHPMYRDSALVVVVARVRVKAALMGYRIGGCYRPGVVCGVLVAVAARKN